MNEDKIVYEKLFKDKNHSSSPPTFLELGAFDGKRESNTRFFEVCLGWKGLLIEGNPRKYQELVTNRPGAHRMSFAPSCDATIHDNQTVAFHDFPWTNAGMEGHALGYKGDRTVDVPCGKLGPVLQDIFPNKEPISFFSLDVEGAEVLVLNTIDFSKVMIEVMMIEIKNAFCKDNSCETRQQIRAKMKQEGYQRYEGLVAASDVYVHPNSRFQISRSVAKPVA